jgi:dihydrofolate reductase
MGKVVVGATVSLDGYIAGRNESGFEHLFAWFAGGDVEFPTVMPEFKIRLTEPDYRYMRGVVEGIGVFVVGRRMFDLSHGWGGRHPFDSCRVERRPCTPARLRELLQ